MGGILQRRAVLIVLDGARPDVLLSLLSKGDLPNIARSLVEPGAVRVATTAFPSTTGPAYIPFLVGRFPAAAGVPGIRWFDRDEQRTRAGRWRAARSYCGVQAGWINRDLDPTPTLFELTPSVGVCSPITRGLPPAAHLMPVRRALIGSAAHYVPRLYAKLDDAVAEHWSAAAMLSWRFLLVVFPGIDGVTHFDGPLAETVEDRYRAVDRALGRFLARWRSHVREPLPDLFLVSDHGASDVRQHTDLALALEGRGTPTVRHPIHVWRRGARAAVMVSGNGSAQVYLDPLSERRRPLAGAEIPDDLLDFLVSLPGVDLVALRDGHGGVRVRSGRGSATVTDVAGSVRIANDGDGDVFAIGASGVFEDRALLERTLPGPLPDAPRQLLSLLAERRTGDLVLSAKLGFDFRDDWEIPEHRAGHGALIREHMLVPLAASIPLPDVPMRTADLMPTILERLGVAAPDGIDGVPAASLGVPVLSAEAV